MSKLDDLLARYYVDGGNFEAEDYLHAYGDPRQTLLAFRAYWPELTRVDGYVVLKSFVDSAETLAACRAGLERGDRPKQEFLKGYRWDEVAYLFARNTLAEGDDQRLAELMTETWLGAVSLFEPSIPWQTRALTPEETGSVWGVCFEEATALS